MKCPHCNQEHPDGALFCPTTGIKIKILNACTNFSCSNYGKHLLPLNVLFCPTCGCKIEEIKEISWQDFKGFLREEKEKRSEVGFDIDDILKFIIGMLIPIVNVYLLLQVMFYGIMRYIVNKRRKNIMKFAYDIEITHDEIKIIRDEKRKYGLCAWIDYDDNKLLLEPAYENIKKGCKNSCVLYNDNKYGLYSFEVNRIIAECIYDKVEVHSEEVYKLFKNGEVSWINTMGDRIIT